MKLLRFEENVDDEELLKTILTQLHTAKTRLDQHAEYNPNGGLGVLRTPEPF